MDSRQLGPPADLGYNFTLRLDHKPIEQVLQEKVCGHEWYDLSLIT